MTRSYRQFVGIDLGGSRGKSTAVARLRWNGGSDDAVWVDEVATRHNGEPWSDDVLLEYLCRLGPTAVVSHFGNNNGLVIGPEMRCCGPRSPGRCSRTTS